MALGHNLALSSNKSRETREISPQKLHRQFGALSHIYLRVMLGKPCTLSSYPKAKPTSRYALISAHCEHPSRVKPATSVYSLLDSNTLLGSHVGEISRTLPLSWES